LKIRRNGGSIVNRLAEYNTIIYEKDTEDHHIAFITLNAPEKNNRISLEMLLELIDAVDRVNKDDDTKAVIFKANGDNFSAGFDLSAVYRVYGGSLGVRPRQSQRLQSDFDHAAGLPRAVIFCNKVAISQVQGWCIEAGMWIVQCSDLAIASKDAKFAHRGQRLAFGGMPFMPFELFQGHTKKITEFLMTGRTISGKEAEEIGIITKAVEPDDLEETVYNLAKVLVLLPRDAIVMGKMRRRMSYEIMGAYNFTIHPVFHTLATNLVYADDEKENVFLRNRERSGERAAFHKLHDTFEEALDKTKYFKSFGRD